MRFNGHLRIGAPASIVWDLLTNVESFPRYTPTVTRVHRLSGGEGVGATGFTMVLSNGRSVHCAQFTSVWEPPRRVVANAKVGLSHIAWEYELVAAKSECAGYRAAQAPTQTELRWSIKTTLLPIAWVLAPFALFIPVFALAQTGRRHKQLMDQLKLVAEADETRSD